MDGLASAPTIDIAVIKTKPGRARREFDQNKLNELKESIRRTGGLLQPIVISTEMIEGKDEIVLIAGERRFRAHLLLAMEDPAYRQVKYTWFKDLPPLEQARAELDENLHRVNLTDWEINELYDKIATLEGSIRGTQRGDPNAFKLTEISDKTGEPYSTVKARINFHRDMVARPDIKEQVKDKPVFTAMKEAKRIMEAERAQAALDIGQITISQDFRCGDSRQLITTLPNESVSLILSDFPFAIPDLADSQSEAQLYTGLMKHSDNLTTKEVDDFTRELAPQLFRVLKPGSYMAIFFGWDCKYFMEHYFRYVGFEVDSEPIIWDKQSTTGSFKGYSPAPCYEQIMWCVKPPRTRRMSEPMKKILYCPPVKKDIRTHVFEKPVALLNEIIKRTTNVGETVLDVCAGTGSVIKACIELKRTAIGFELDQQHYALGCQSIFELQQRLTGVKA